jgi:D-sedoheptulose 7-phosphate isomerase
MFADFLDEHRRCFEKLAGIETEAQSAVAVMTKVLKKGGKVLVCGNGGSAADAQHFVAELVGRFEHERRALAAVALTTDTSIMTAVANDYDFSRVFARQVEALGKAGDVLVGISTSGMSGNVGEAFRAAGRQGLATIGLLGGDGGRLKSLCDAAVVVPATRTARVQEAHVFILHVWAAAIEAACGETPADG